MIVDKNEENLAGSPLGPGKFVIREISRFLEQRKHTQYNATLDLAVAV